MGKYIIGIDHGYGYIKTTGNVFMSGIDEYPVEPPLLKNVIKYQDNYYVAGEHRKLYAADKTATMDYYLLTLAAVAKECLLRGADRQINVILAVGLPLEYYGVQKKEFREYLMQNRDIAFEFEGIPFQVHIEDVRVFPQGYAVIANKIAASMNEILVDIGTGTMDILPIVNGNPQISSCVSLPMGVSVCIEQVQREFRRTYNTQLDDFLIQDVMQGKQVTLNTEYLKLLKKEITRYTQQVFEELAQKGYHQGFQELRFCGGGASVVKRYGKYDKGMTNFLEDIHANAKGYEYLCRALLKAEK